MDDITNQTPDTTQTTPAATPATEPAATPAQPAADPTPAPALTEESYGDLGLVQSEDIKIDQAQQSAFKKLAAELQLPVDTAKKLAKFQYDAVKKQNDDFKTLQNQWEQENTKLYGDNLKNVKTNAGRVLQELDKSGKFKELLHLAGAEEAPATLEFLKSIGDQLLEKGSVNPNAAAPVEEKDLEAFY